MDVLKTRLMIQGQNGRYKNVLDCAVKIVQEEGAGALFRGWQPRVIWIGVWFLLLLVLLLGVDVVIDGGVDHHHLIILILLEVIFY